MSATCEASVCRTCLSRQEIVGLAIATVPGFISSLSRNFIRFYMNIPRKEWRLFKSPLDVYMFSLLVSDFLQGFGKVLNIRWLHLHVVHCGRYCTTQGATQQVGEAGVAQATLIRIKTNFFKRRDTKLPESVSAVPSRDAYIMLLYPASYFFLVLPDSVIRWMVFNNIPVPTAASFFATCVFGLSGIVNVCLLWYTRPGLLLLDGMPRSYRSNQSTTSSQTPWTSTGATMVGERRQGTINSPTNDMTSCKIGLIFLLRKVGRSLLHKEKGYLLLIGNVDNDFRSLVFPGAGLGTI
ncbi:hypothetical protein Clacol_007037 [Clathrus columnatus]|uniref:G protein-coupled receptor n=1 Tax=Clathrus columnatus TaxID=1419009 RepID=A0AAV5AGP1_9AGAM|nr:hypothetical protein Clacol_007037 [Clathrus columnatus]